MKFVLFFIVASLSTSVAARSRHVYHATKAFEAGQESEDRQVHAIRECAVSRIQSCVYPIIEHLKKEGPENTQLRRESANALGLRSLSSSRGSEEDESHQMRPGPAPPVAFLPDAPMKPS